MKKEKLKELIGQMTLEEKAARGKTFGIHRGCHDWEYRQLWFRMDLMDLGSRMKAPTI